jgi:hypothetical protein
MKETEVRPQSNAEAKHINFQLKIQENIIHIYTKCGDSLNAERSMLHWLADSNLPAQFTVKNVICF